MEEVNNKVFRERSIYLKEFENIHRERMRKTKGIKADAVK